MQFVGPVLVLVWKDLLLEWRSRDMVVSVLFFGLLVVVLFNFALDAGSQQIGFLAPGILWLAFTFAATLAMNRSFVREREQGGLEGFAADAGEPGCHIPGQKRSAAWSSCCWSRRRCCRCSPCCLTFPLSPSP